MFDQFFEFCHDDFVLFVGELVADVCYSSCLLPVCALQRPVNLGALRHLFAHVELNASACNDNVVEKFRDVGVSSGRVPEAILFVVLEIFHQSSDFEFCVTLNHTPY